MIRIDALWLSTEPLDMRAGTETALARVVAVLAAARPPRASPFANRRATRSVYPLKSSGTQASVSGWRPGA
mgnify:CR=1 FL=1